MRYIKDNLAKARGERWWIGKTAGELECTQRGGDLIWIPASFSHFTFNLWPSVAVNHEVNVARQGSTPAGSLGGYGGAGPEL